MKIWYPISCSDLDNVNVPDYIHMCNVSLSKLRQVLIQHIDRSKIVLYQTKLSKLPYINKLTNLNLYSIMMQYINSLSCHFDTTNNKCYFAVPHGTRAIGTANTLNFIVRLIEYGNDSIPPMYWIRRSYTKYKKYIMENSI